MVVLAGYTLTDTLREAPGLVVYRGSRSDGSPVIAVVAREQAAQALRDRLESEFSLRGELDPAWALVPLELMPQAGSLALILAFGLPLAVYLLRNYIGSLPSSIIESARIDGADHFTIFWRLIIPLSVPALAAFAIFQFLWVWNDLLIAYVFLGGSAENRVLTIALADLVGSRGENWHLLTSAAFLSMALPLAVFFSLQRYFVRGLTAGSVKG
jgi:ABC-type maltose transport system permease subunit